MKNNSVNFRKENSKTLSFRKNYVIVSKRDKNGFHSFNIKYNQIDRFIKEYK